MHQHQLRSPLRVKDSILIGAASTASVASASVVRVIYSRSAKLEVDFSSFLFPISLYPQHPQEHPAGLSGHHSPGSANFPPLTPLIWCSS